MKHLRKITRFIATPYALLFGIFGVVFLLAGISGYYHQYKQKTEAIYTTRTQSLLSSDEAEQKIKNQPEVKKLFENGKNWFVLANDYDKYWMVQVAEAVEDTPINGQRIGHTATFNWYYIDKNTGEIVCAWYEFDSDGNFIKKPANICF